MRRDEYGDPTKEAIKQVLRYGLLVIIGLVLFFGSWYTVGVGERGVLVTLGKPSLDAKEPGFHFKAPLVQDVVAVNVRTLKYEADATAASHDLQDVHTKVAVNYHIDPSRAVEVYQKLGLGYEGTVIQPAVQESVKAVTAKFTAEELITKREMVKVQIQDILKTRLLERGIIAEEMSITDFDFSQSFNAAIEAKVTAEQLKLKADRDLERIRIEAEQVAVQADGQKRAKIAAAEAEAESIRIVQNQLDKSPEYTKWYTVNKWNGELPKVTGGAIPLVEVST